MHLRLVAFSLVLGLTGVTILGGCRDPVSGPPVAEALELTGEMIERHNRGVGLMGQFEFSAAHNVFAELLDEHAGWPHVTVDLAIATLNRQRPGDMEMAASLLDGLLENEIGDVRALYCRAVVHLNNGQATQALRLFQQVAKRDPQDAYATYFAGQCLFEISKYDDAFRQFQRAIKVDPYLRSAYYGAFNAARRIGKQDESRDYLDQFQKLENNPQARFAEIKYTRMGSKAMVQALDMGSATDTPLAKGPPFSPATELLLLIGENTNWRVVAQGAAVPSVTVCDINGDGQRDLFIASGIQDGETALNAVLMSSDRGFELVSEHALAHVTEVNSVLWADFDNDGHTDAYLCRRGENQLWRQSEPNVWQDETSSTSTGGGHLNTVDGAAIDADHDGDLDLFLVNADGPNELLNNNLDGTFRPLAEQQGIAGDGSGSRQVVFTDIDSDRDVDLIVINDEPPHEVYINDRLWRYHAYQALEEFCQGDWLAAVAADLNADGQVELVAATKTGLVTWNVDDAGNWSREAFTVAAHKNAISGPINGLAIGDVNGSGVLDVVVAAEGGLIVLARPSNLETLREYEYAGDIFRFALANLDDVSGPSAIGLRSGAAPLIWRPGAGRPPFLTFAFTGRENKGEQMRSNASGIGLKAAVRSGSKWTAMTTFRTNSGPGQSLQPIAVGLGGAQRADFVRLDWPDGLMQTESNLRIGQLHRIEETQRQTSSCPVLFAWNGSNYGFVTDLLGVGGIGFNLGNGQYAQPRPWEHLLLPDDSVEPRRKRYELKIGEPMEEACYLDSVRLVQYDLPPGWAMTIDERAAVGEPPPSGDPINFQDVVRPNKVVNDRGTDVTKLVAAIDGQAAPVGRLDRRFVGVTEEHWLEMTFDDALDVTADDLILVFDGWIEYPYSQTMFAAWQAGKTYEAPTLEALGQDGQWHAVLPNFGYMAGMPRQSSVPIPMDRLPKGTKRLRLSTNMEIYWDRLLLVISEPCHQVRRTELPLLKARIDEPGFAARRTLAQRRPFYDYGRRAPLWDTRHQAGFYTAFGDAIALLAETDDAIAIIGPGEEVHLEFGASQSPPWSGWTRRLVLEAHGWCKDMDLYTQHGEMVEPLPRYSADTTDASSVDDTEDRRQRLHEEFNTRYRGGYTGR